MYKYLLIEDNNDHANVLLDAIGINFPNDFENLLKDENQRYIADGGEALNYINDDINKLNIDIAFIDYDIPTINGANLIGKFDSKTKIYLYTNSDKQDVLDDINRNLGDKANSNTNFFRNIIDKFKGSKSIQDNVDFEHIKKGSLETPNKIIEKLNRFIEIKEQTIDFTYGRDGHVATKSIQIDDIVLYITFNQAIHKEILDSSSSHDIYKHYASRSNKTTTQVMFTKSKEFFISTAGSTNNLKIDDFANTVGSQFALIGNHTVVNLKHFKKSRTEKYLINCNIDLKFNLIESNRRTNFWINITTAMRF